jgi:ACT domain-containing protein
MLQIFVEQVSERLIYTLHFVFKERGLDYVLTNDYHSFVDSPHKKLNYSERYFDKIVQLTPCSILFDEEIIVYGIHSGSFYGEDCLTFNRIVDPLAAIFYVISRMEEYTSSIEDEHGRFPAKNSVLYRFGWLEKAMCDRWAEAFLKFLNDNELIEYKKARHKVELVPTFDIDNAYAYQFKGGVRSLLSTARDILKGDRFRLNEREQVRRGTARDPYDTYEYIESIVDKGFNVKMFWLLGDYSKFDRNISHKDPRHQRLIRKMDRLAHVGIHPSYKSNSYEYYLNAEKERLEEILNRPVDHARQHFLKLKLPITYQHLEDTEIRHDYTMGYAEHVGFRAGTARPHKWFDLSRNRVSQLTVHPFAYMDGTLNEYLALDTSGSKQIIEKLYQEVKKYGGNFVFIWHNETIGNYGKWVGWKDVLEYTLDLNSEKKHE